MVALIVLAAAYATAANPLDGLSLTISTTRPTLLVGEPARLEVTWSASRPIGVAFGQMRVFIEDRDSFRQWSEASMTIRQEIELTRTLEPGRPRKTVHVLSVTGSPQFVAGGRLSMQGRFAFAFPRPGSYRVRADYGTNPVRSNWLSLKVMAPTGREAELFEQHIGGGPEILSDFVLYRDNTLLPKLFEQYPRSAYLARPKVLFRERQIREAFIAAPDRHGQDPVAGEVPALLDQLERDDLGDSPFDEDRLLLLAEMTEQYGRRDKAVAAWRRILAKYPNGFAAEEARRRISNDPQDPDGPAPAVPRRSPRACVDPQRLRTWTKVDQPGVRPRRWRGGGGRTADRLRPSGRRGRPGSTSGWPPRGTCRSR